jgi:hypothetical protein
MGKYSCNKNSLSSDVSTMSWEWILAQFLLAFLNPSVFDQLNEIASNELTHSLPLPWLLVVQHFRGRLAGRRRRHLLVHLHLEGFLLGSVVLLAGGHCAVLQRCKKR